MNKSAEKSRAARRGRPSKNTPSTGSENPKKVSDVTEKPVIKSGQDDKKVARQSRLAKNAKGKDPASLLNVPKRAEMKSNDATPKVEPAVRRGRPPKLTEPLTSPPKPNEAEKPGKSEGRAKPRGNSETKTDGKREDPAAKPLDQVRQTRRKAAATTAAAAAAEKSEGDPEPSKVVPESAAREETPDAISPKRRGRPRKTSGGQEEAASRTTPEKSPRPNRTANPVAEEAAAAANDVPPLCHFHSSLGT